MDEHLQNFKILLQLLVFISKDAVDVNIQVQVFLWTHSFILLRDISISDYCISECLAL